MRSPLASQESWVGWPRVVTGAAARILSMVMDIAGAFGRRSDCANGCQEQEQEKEGNEYQIDVAYAACLNGADPPFSRTALLAATWAVLEGSNAPA